jgi:hypothetical protein
MTGAGEAAKPTIAWLGLGIMGQAMAANLLRSGLFGKLLVWNRSADKCAALVKEGAVAVATPAEAVQQADIVFGMLADPAAALDVSAPPRAAAGVNSPALSSLVCQMASAIQGASCVPRERRPSFADSQGGLPSYRAASGARASRRVPAPHPCLRALGRAVPQVAFGEKGVVSAMQPGKAYVDMSTVDEDTSKKIAEAGEPSHSTGWGREGAPRSADWGWGRGGGGGGTRPRAHRSRGCTRSIEGGVGL